MAAPPTDISPTELWLALDQREAPHKVFPFPSKSVEAQIRISVMTIDAVERCRTKIAAGAAKDGWDAERQKGFVESEIIGDRIAREILQRAVRTFENKGSEDRPHYPLVFPAPESLMRLQPDELAVLWSYYMSVQQEYGPMETIKLERGEEELWIKRLVEGGSAAPLALLDLPQRDALTLSLAQKASFLSEILGRHLKDLPSALILECETCGFDISSSGEQPAESSQKTAPSKSRSTSRKKVAKKRAKKTKKAPAQEPSQESTQDFPVQESTFDMADAREVVKTIRRVT